MAERAHPEDPAFADRWHFRRRLGFIPWIQRVRNPFRQALVERYRWVSRYSQGKRLLDVPCGTGWGTSLLAADRVTGLDLSDQAIAEARRLYPDAGEFLTGSMDDLPFADASFDIVCCLEGIEHVPESVGARFVHEAHRVLSESGQLFTSSPRTLEPPYNEFHLREYHLSEIKALLNTHFDVTEVIRRQTSNLEVHLLRCNRRPVQSLFRDAS